MAAVMIGAALALAVSAGPASAHAELESVTPANGSTVTVAPSAVVLTFGEDIGEIGSSAVVLDAAGNEVQIDPLKIDGPVVTIALQAITEAGDYHVNFRVTSRDGHVVSDSLTFTYAPEAEPTAVLTASPEVSPVTSTDPTVAYWVTGLLMALGALAAIAAWRAKR